MAIFSAAEAFYRVAAALSRVVSITTSKTASFREWFGMAGGVWLSTSNFH